METTSGCAGGGLLRAFRRHVRSQIDEATALVQEAREHEPTDATIDEAARRLARLKAIQADIKRKQRKLSLVERA